MAALDAYNLLTFVTILLLTFALFLLITGAFTAYFGSGKSRKIGAGLLVGGLVVGILWAYYVYAIYRPLPVVSAGTVGLGTVVIQAIGVIVAAVIGAAAAIGLFLLAIMKS
jgi:membrane protease YdiL (CAAX protease family)